MNSIGLAVCWLLGCALGVSILSDQLAGVDPVYGMALIALALLFFLLALAVRSDRQALWSFLFIGCALAACGNALVRHTPVTPTSLAYYNGPTGSAASTVIGTVAAEPVLSDRSQRLRLDVSQIRPANENTARPVSGDLVVVVSRYPVYDVGERLVLSGTLTSPPSSADFDYAAYLARQGVFSYMAFPRTRSLVAGASSPLQDMVSDTRAGARSVLNRVLPEPEAALAIGVVVGDRTTMSEDIQEDFSRSGTVHVLAISGQNISLLVGFVWLLFASKDKRARMPLWLLAGVLLLLFAYTLFTGATASVVRAAIMASVLLLGPVVGRRYDPVAALGVSALFMTLFTPALIFDAGFDLSFGAMLGIGVMAPAIQSAFARARMPYWLSAVLSAGLGAQAMTLPLTLLLTGRLSLVTPLATMTIDPALLPLMVLGILTVAIGQVPLLAPLTVLLGWLMWLPAGWMVVTIILVLHSPLVSKREGELAYNPLEVDLARVPVDQALYLEGFKPLALFFPCGRGQARTGIFCELAYAVRGCHRLLALCDCVAYLGLCLCQGLRSLIKGFVALPEGVTVNQGRLCEVKV